MTTLCLLGIIDSACPPSPKKECERRRSDCDPTIMADR